MRKNLVQIFQAAFSRIPNKGHGFPPYKLEELRCIKVRKFASIRLPPPSHELCIRPPKFHTVMLVNDQRATLVGVIWTFRRWQWCLGFLAQLIAFDLATYISINLRRWQWRLEFHAQLIDFSLATDIVIDISIQR